jgi:glycosyltransferase involved in cell wall biosynthesis
VVAYVISQYPTISHTFIEREIAAVRAAGVEVVPVTIRPTPPDRIFSDADRRAAETTTVLLPLRLRTAVRALLLPMLRHPRAFFETFAEAHRTSPPGLRARVWRVFYFVEAMMLWRLCMDRGIRHIHAHFANAGSNLAWLAADFGRRAQEPDADGDTSWTWSFTMHGCTEFYDVGFYNLADKVRDATFVACVSDFTRSQLLRLVDEGEWPKTTVVRCGVDPEVFRPRPRDDPAEPDRLEVLFVGRLVVEKGLAVLLDAVALLQERGVRFRVTLVGDGERRAFYEAEAARRGLTEAMRFVGWVGQDDIVACYQEADAFCMTSFGEGLPVVLMEALACEVPVVTTWISGIPELVEHEATGLLVPPGRADLLADALERLAADPGLRRRLGEEGRRRVLELCDVGVSGQLLADRFAATLTAR